MQQQLNKLTFYSLFIIPSSSETSDSKLNTIEICKNKTEGWKSFIVKQALNFLQTKQSTSKFSDVYEKLWELDL